jgi:tetratricopeptide (TPR) repeat protein
MPKNPIKDKVFHLSAFLFCAVLGFFIYRNSFDVPFVFDDIFNIVDNAAIRSINDFKSLWFYDPSRFLTHYTFALNFHFGGLDVHGYHWVNLMVHLLAAGACYAFLNLLVDDSANLPARIFPYRRWITAGATLLFVCHPIQTQAVTYISQRSTPLAALCYLSALIFYIRFRKQGGWKNYLISVGFAFAGLFTKPIIVTLPLAMILCEVMFLSRIFPKTKRIWIGLAPFLLMAVAVPVLLILWRDKNFHPDQFLTITRESSKYSRWEYLLTEFNVITTYFRLLLFPVNQKLDYDFPIASNFFAFPTWLSFLAILVVFYFALRIYSKHKLISFGLLWIFVTLSLESSIFPISDVIFEHRLYLPMVGFSLVVSYSLVLLTLRRPKAFFILVAVLAIACGVLTHRRNAQWRDSLGFYLDMAQEFPNKARILNNLGNYYAERKNWEAALRQYEKALKFDPSAAGTYNNIANVYGEQGKFSESIKMLEEVVAHDPRFAPAYYNLGIIYASPQYKQYNKAMEYFRKTLQIDPMFVQALVGIANLYGSTNQLDKARFYLEQARAVNPGYAPLYEDLGHLYFSQEQYDLAAQYYQEALRRNSQVAVVRNNLANIYAMRGQNDLAIAEYRNAIQSDSNYAGAYANLANLLKRSGNPQAKAYFQKALKLYEQQHDGLMIEKIKAELREAPAKP